METSIGIVLLQKLKLLAFSNLRPIDVTKQEVLSHCACTALIIVYVLLVLYFSYVGHVIYLYDHCVTEKTEPWLDTLII